MIRINVDVLKGTDTFVTELCQQSTDHGGAERALAKMAGKDRLEQLTGNGKARVRVELGETLGGPEFSSVRVHVAVEVACHQDDHTVTEVTNHLYDEGISIMDTLVGPAYKGLLAHLERLHGGT
jgi:hypothetical protein